MRKLSLLVSAAFLVACSSAQSTEASSEDKSAPVPVAASGQTDTAILAGGCFWCVESDFEKFPGVIEVVSGYTGGDMLNPTYRNHGQHIEAAEITFDPAQVTYKQIVDHYWITIDPTDPYGQFCDKGNAYTTAIFARPDQIDIAKMSKEMIEANKPFKDPIVTPVREAKTFWDAEDYHQDYYKKNPLKYKYYRNGCRRDKTLSKLWGDKATSYK